MRHCATIEQWTEFLKHGNPRSRLEVPFKKQQNLISYLFEPDENRIKQVDLCCGRGYGKSVLAIFIATMALSLSPHECILFLEPDWKRVRRVFLKKWVKFVPPHLYTLNKGEQCITWLPTGALLFYGPRNITGSYAGTDDSQLGQDTTGIIDDEAALRCSEMMYVSNLATIREPSKVRFYLTMSTPRLGPYKSLITSPGHVLFRGHSADNPYTPDGYVENLRVNMSDQQAARELDGEFISLEGSLWPTAEIETPWPEGNLDTIHTGYDKNKPYWLLCDFGGATASYVIVQQRNAYYNGRDLFRGVVWVAVAELCPYDDASASRAFQAINKQFGEPVAVTGGGDMLKHSDVDGNTIAAFTKQLWPRAHLYPANENVYNKQMQYDSLTYLVRAVNQIDGMGIKERRFTVAQNFVSLEPRSKRGVIEMFQEDEWPPEEQRRPSDFLPKNKNIRVQHTRDALLMGAAEIMHPPTWRPGSLAG